VTDPDGEGEAQTPQIDRAAAFSTAHASQRIPRRVVIWAFVIAAILTLAGTLGEKAFSGAGLNPSSAATNTSTSTTTTSTIPASSADQISASLPAMMSLVTLDRPAPALKGLIDQSGRRFALDELRGKVVVLSFFSLNCNDICPVLTLEIEGAVRDLGPLARHLAFVTVNADPLQPVPASASAALVRTGITHLPDSYILNGPLQALNAVWRDYGVTIDVAHSTGAIAHNDVLYFIGPGGQLEYRATPFAEESRSGAYTVPPGVEAAWARGIAAYARRLVGSR
jgi:cytochrome oxidase Cu insertion factor (SCO1/SenC/PrrC family)